MINFYERWFTFFNFEEIFSAPRNIDNKREIQMCLANFFTELAGVRTLEVKNPNQAIVARNMFIGSPDAIGPNDYFLNLCNQNGSITSILNRCERDTGYSDPQLIADINRRLQIIASQLKPVTSTKKFTA